jgi:hypothetical protein
MENREACSFDEKEDELFPKKRKYIKIKIIFIRKSKS